MSRLNIKINPDSILREKTKKIAKITPEIERLIFDMAQTMKKAQGAGLAAPQVGYNLSLCLINTDKGPLALINPQITWKSIRTDIEEEGCLSVPETFGLVKRHKIIYVKALNQKGQPIKFRAKGFFARVIQHETDHLKGVLIIDKFEKQKR